LRKTVFRRILDALGVVVRILLYGRGFRSIKLVKYELDLDVEDFIIKFTDSKGLKRNFKVLTSEGLIEYADASGRRYLRVMLEEVK